jgi:uroporphyrin-III C-methyltransferase
MTKLTTKPEPEVKTTPQKKMQPKTKPILWILTTLAIIFAISALYISLHLTHTLDQQAQTFESNRAMLIQQQSGTEARLQAHRVEAQTNETNAKTAIDTLRNNVKSTLAECNHVSDDWRLEKARYLLEIAQQQAHWTHDNASTYAMLEEADTILAPLRNPALVSVREALAHDISEQKSAPTHDITALLVQLSSLDKSTWTLPVKPLPENTTKNNPDITKTTRFACAINALKSLAVIRYNPDTLQPKPTLAYEAILRATVRLNLQEATWAVLERNDSVYQLALTQATRHLEQTFASNTTQTQALITHINQLKQTKLYQTTPIPKRALHVLNQVISSTEIKAQTAGDAS